MNQLTIYLLTCIAIAAIYYLFCQQLLKQNADRYKVIIPEPPAKESE